MTFELLSKSYLTSTELIIVETFDGDGFRGLKSDWANASAGLWEGGKSITVLADKPQVRRMFFHFGGTSTTVLADKPQVRRPLFVSCHPI